MVFSRHVFSGQLQSDCPIKSSEINLKYWVFSCGVVLLVFIIGSSFSVLSDNNQIFPFFRIGGFCLPGFSYFEKNKKIFEKKQFFNFEEEKSKKKCFYPDCFETNLSSSRHGQLQTIKKSYHFFFLWLRWTKFTCRWILFKWIWIYHTSRYSSWYWKWS